MSETAKIMMSTEEIADLVARAKAGERPAFESLARQFFRAVYAVALAQVRRPADAEDVAQDAMILAFERIASCREPSRFGGWVTQIARNQGRNWQKRYGRRERASADVEGPRRADVHSDDGSETAARRLVLMQALACLTDFQAEIVLLHDLEGWTHPEIANALGISIALSRWNLFMSRKVLRLHLDGYRMEESGGV